MKPHIGLSDEQRAGVVRLLNTLLADEYLLAVKTRNYRWNVYGPHFTQLHRLFQEQYELIDEMIDTVAQRVRTVGGNAIGTLAELQEAARLDEAPGEYPDARAMVLTLLGDHEATVTRLRRDLVEANDEFEDVGTGSLLTDLLERHERMAWALRATASTLEQL